jgi:hypothetical protein
VGFVADQLHAQRGKEIAGGEDARLAAADEQRLPLEYLAERDKRLPKLRFLVGDQPLSAEDIVSLFLDGARAR